MPLVIGHALAGATICAATGTELFKSTDRKLLAAAALLAVLPDVDLIFPWILGLGVGWHGGFTHSIIFACLSGDLAAHYLRRGEISQISQIRWTLVLSGAALTHPLLDAAMKRTLSGAALFWPVSSKVFKFGLFDYFAFYPDSGLDPPLTLALRALEISIYELLIFGSVFAAVSGLRKFWSAATCHRFDLSSSDSRLESGESGDKSPHSKT
jgi:membrane-bound metal-dependent hydrolase YbcI (DUF457 family)